MRRSVMVVLGVLSLSLAAANGAVAQKKTDGAPSRRQGFWFGLGAAAGSAGMECTGCGSDRKSGGSGYVRLGGTLSPHWLLGAEIDGWARSESGTDMALANVAFTASWYPSRTGGFFLKFGLGALAYQEDDGTDKTEVAGGSAIIGIGFDIPIGRRSSLTPFLNSIASSKSTVKFNGTEMTGFEANPNLVQVGLALSWH
jgi:hypothetical protein